MPGTRKLGRPTAHRQAMLRGMVTYLLENGSIETTLTRAKEVRAMAEKMITLGKANTLASRRQALAYITKEDVVSKLFDQIAPKYANTNGDANIYDANNGSDKMNRQKNAAWIRCEKQQREARRRG